MPRKNAKPPAAAQWNQRVKIVEEYAALDEQVENFKPLLSRHQMLRGLILGWYPSASAEEEISVAGASCDIIISARDKIRAVTEAGKQKLYRLWGSRDFIAKSHVLLKSLPDPKDEAGLYTIQSLTGPRHLRVVAKSRATVDTAA